MSYTTEQYKALKAAIAEGALKVKYKDKEIEYRSLRDMLSLQKVMEAELGIKPKQTRLKMYTSKGL